MFEELPDAVSHAELDDATVVAAIEGWTRAVATAAAHRLAFIAELTSRRYDEDWDIAEDACDVWDSAAAEISAASGISQGRASDDMEVGAALSSRLPGVGALLMAGDISEYVARTIVTRTALMQDPELLAQVDGAITQAARHWGVLSKKKVESGIDVLVDRYDPGALTHTRTRVRGRGIRFGNAEAGTTEISGRLASTDAALVDRRLTAMATGVCDGDPRTFEQRRADAMGAFGAGSLHLACQCANPRCAKSADDGRASTVVVHVYAEEAALAATPDPLTDGDQSTPEGDGVAQSPDAERGSGSDPTVTGDVDDALDAVPAPTRPPAGLIPGFGIIPASLLAGMITRGKGPVRPSPGRRSRNRLSPLDHAG